MIFKTKAPGSLMLFGEHAVLEGYPGLVAAINHYMHVELVPRSDNCITISSKKLGRYQTTIDCLEIASPFQFVLACLAQVQPLLKSGCDLTISSDFSHQIGFGSSAAVTVALQKALSLWLELDYNLQAIFEYSLQAIRSIQTVGSGADAAASTFGGIVDFGKNIISFKSKLPLLAIYCGYKTATVVVIKKVQQTMAKEVCHQIFEKMAAITEQAKIALKEQNWPAVGLLANQHNKLQEQLGVSDQTLHAINNCVRQQKNIFGSKISGSGLGDCVVAIGQLNDVQLPWHTIALEISQHGVIESA